MRLTVVVCPGCRRVQAAEARFERPACVGCQSALVLRDLKSFYVGDDGNAARAAVMWVGASIHGMEGPEIARVMARVRQESRGSVDDVVSALRSATEFGEAEFRAAMDAHRAPGAPERVLEALVAANRVYEPRAGRYRVL